jgi:hypothetical protein
MPNYNVQSTLSFDLSFDSVDARNRGQAIEQFQVVLREFIESIEDIQTGYESDIIPNDYNVTNMQVVELPQEQSTNGYVSMASLFAQQSQPEQASALPETPGYTRLVD